MQTGERKVRNSNRSASKGYLRPSLQVVHVAMEFSVAARDEGSFEIKDVPLARGAVRVEYLWAIP